MSYYCSTSLLALKIAEALLVTEWIQSFKMAPKALEASYIKLPSPKEVGNVVDH